MKQQDQSKTKSKAAGSIRDLEPRTNVKGGGSGDPLKGLNVSKGGGGGCGASCGG
jgi:hypothetical protein